MLERLKDRLADREEEMADIRTAELRTIRGPITTEEKWHLYADLDEIEAERIEQKKK